MTDDATLRSVEVRDFDDVGNLDGRSYGREAPRVPFDGDFDVDHDLAMYGIGIPNGPVTTDREWGFHGWVSDRQGGTIVSRQKAHFWFVAATLNERLQDESPQIRSRDVLRGRRYDGVVTPDEASTRLAHFCETAIASQPRGHYPYTARMLEMLLGTTTSVRVVLESVPREAILSYVSTMGWPSRDDPAFPALVERAREIAEPLALKDWDEVAACAHLLARLPVQALLPRIIDALMATTPRYGGLTEAVEVLSEIDDLSPLITSLAQCSSRGAVADPTSIVVRALRLHGHHHVRDFLALKLKKTSFEASLFRLWEKLHSRHIVPTMLTFSTKKVEGERARQWILHEGANAIVELFAIATGKSAKKEIARTFLAQYLDRGHRDLVVRLLADQPAPIRAAITTLLGLAGSTIPTSTAPASPTNEAPNDTRNGSQGSQGSHARDDVVTLATNTAATTVWPLWVDEVMPPASAALDTIPSWWAKTGEAVPANVERAIRSLLTSGIKIHDEREDGQRLVVDGRLTEVAELLDPARARHVAFSLVEAHIRNKLTFFTYWALHALLLFPSTEAIEALEEALMGHRKAAARDEGRAYSTQILERVESCGAPAAMLALTRSNSGNVKYIASAWLKREAGRSRVSGVVFRLSLASTCSLDATGATTFLLGARAFKATLVDADTFQIRDPEGHPIAVLPSARGDEDAVLVDRERERSKRIREQITRTVADVKAAIHEASPGTARWTVPRWRQAFLSHPVLFHVGRCYLWNVENEMHRGLTLRLAEDRTLADIDDNEVKLESLGEGTVLSPVRAHELDPSMRKRWLELLASYRQLGAIASLQEA